MSQRAFHEDVDAWRELARPRRGSGGPPTIADEATSTATCYLDLCDDGPIKTIQQANVPWPTDWFNLRLEVRELPEGVHALVACLGGPCPSHQFREVIHAATSLREPPMDKSQVSLARSICRLDAGPDLLFC